MCTTGFLRDLLPIQWRQCLVDKSTLSTKHCLVALPDLDDLIAEVDRTCDTATDRHGAEPDQPDWLALLTVAAGVAGRLQALADDLIEDYVEHCRMHGYTWSDIGSVLGVSRQAAQQRFLAPHRRYSPDEFTEELRDAMAETKRLAVQHRNNYIGTEHLLLGLLCADNAATRMLGSLDVSIDDLRRSLRARLSMGASQAAERIAFTPYARKALAIADEHATGKNSGTDKNPGSGEGSATIGCDDLLLGLVTVGRGAAAALLAEIGIDLPAVEPSGADLPDP